MRSERPTHIPANWPKWKRQCNALIWSKGRQCQGRAILGADKCKAHGGAGAVSGERAWKRYLLWILLPDTIRQTALWSPVLDEEVEMVSQIVAHAVLYGDQHASESVRMAAAEYLLDAAAVAQHPDPALLLTHLPREDADTAVRILRENGLIR